MTGLALGQPANPPEDNMTDTAKERRRAAALKGAATRKANRERKEREWEERGRYENAATWELESLHKRGNVTLAPAAGDPVVIEGARVSTGQDCLIVGEIRVSLTRVTITPCEWLHPASLAYLLRACIRILDRWEYRVPDGAVWIKGTDEDLSECYTREILRPIVSEEESAELRKAGVLNSGALLDVDPLDALLHV